MSALSIVLTLVEAIVLSFFLSIMYFVLSKNTKVGFVLFADTDIQKEAIHLRLIDEDTISKKNTHFCFSVVFLLFIFAPFLVYKFNSPEGFVEAFLELSLIYIVMSCFDYVLDKSLLFKARDTLREVDFVRLKACLPKVHPLREAFGYIAFSFFSAALVTFFIEIFILAFKTIFQ